MKHLPQLRIGSRSLAAANRRGSVCGLFLSAILLAAAVPALPAQVQVQTSSSVDVQPVSAGDSGSSLTVAEQYLFAAANQDRALHGLPALRLDPVLTRASAFHAREMAEHSDISHQFDGEPDLAERGANAGVHFSLISENVGEAPTSVIIHGLWMESPGHRANLLDPEVDSIGISVVDRDGELYAVEDFASIVQNLPLSQQEKTVASAIAQSGVSLTDTTAEARITCSMSTGYVGRRPRYILRYTASSLNDLPAQLKARLTSGQYHQAEVGACPAAAKGPFSSYTIAVLLYP